MELKLQIPDKTAKKIKALAMLKGIDADYIGDMISKNIDALVTAHLAKELEIDIDSGSTFTESLEGDADYETTTPVSDREEMSFAPADDHGLSGESEDVIDNTPVPESFVEQAAASTPAPSRASHDGSFSSLVDQNISNADVTNDPEEYMDDMMNFDTSQAKEASMPPTISVPLTGRSGGAREASRSFSGKPRVNISEATHGNA